MNGWSYRLSPRLVLRTRLPQQTEAGEQVLTVQSNDAFPPGHPSTRLCLDLLREALEEAPANRLLDVGCGAGVLSLAAAALGVPQVVAIDLALAAARATRENARQNGLAGSILAVQGSTEAIGVPFDLVLANLPWEVQLDKVKELDRLAAAAGHLILAGFRDNQENLLLEGYQNLGWSRKRRLVKEFYHPELPPGISFNWVAWRLGK
ncbi:MAG: 50S ribosomal protein L11 methyltransferase [Deltaproteobacteria bacterium]|nr:50S ribosomal protein L11 methyltransferase [Deltaproteobacteria bacterium]